MRFSRLAPLLAAAFVVVALLAGCGGGGSSDSDDNGVADKTAEQIVSDAADAAKGALSVYVHGTATTSSAPLSIDLHLVRGKGGAGHVETNGQSLDVVAVGGKVYVKGDDAFYKQIGGDAAVQLLHGKWLTASTDNSNFASFAQLVDIDQLVDSVLSQHGTLEKGDTTDVDGQPAIAVEDSSKGGKLYVATTGEPYPLKIDTGGDQKGSIMFSNWNESYDVAAPDDAVDISQLTGG